VAEILLTFRNRDSFASVDGKNIDSAASEKSQTASDESKGVVFAWQTFLCHGLETNAREASRKRFGCSDPPQLAQEVYGAPVGRDSRLHHETWCQSWALLLGLELVSSLHGLDMYEEAWNGAR